MPVTQFYFPGPKEIAEAAAADLANAGINVELYLEGDWPTYLGARREGRLAGLYQDLAGAAITATRTARCTSSRIARMLMQSRTRSCVKVRIQDQDLAVLLYTAFLSRQIVHT